MSSSIKIELTKSPKAKPADQTKLGFGNYFTDHMFVMDYTDGKGWHDGRIIPYGPICLDPSAMVFHYAQEIFEGLKAYRTAGGKVQLFRPQENFKRMNVSCDRMCIPLIDEKFALEALMELIKVDQDWIPTEPDTSLYIRPFIISIDPFLGVRPAKEYKFIIILSPVGAYYPEGLNPVKIYVETEYTRAAKGGTGFTKCGGNYAASLKAQAEAKKSHYTQVLWLDSKEHKYVEEVGTMNVLFKIDGEIVTPALEGSVLSGVTRKSCLDILRHWGYRVSERKISMEELAQAYRDGKLEEAFGSGTAAVISPIGELKWGDVNMEINHGKIGSLTQKLYDTLTGIQWGKIEDPFGWTMEVK